MGAMVLREMNKPALLPGLAAVVQPAKTDLTIGDPSFI